MVPPAKTGKRSYRALFAVLALAALGVGAYLLYDKLVGIEPKPEAMANVPGSATAVAYVRAGNIVRSDAVRLLVRREILEEPIERLRNECGFDPVESIEDVTFFIDGNGAQELDAIGLVARGQFDDRRLLECFRNAFREEGLGTLRYYEIDGVPAAAGSVGEQRAIFLGRHAVAIGRESTMREVIGVVRDNRPAAIADPILRRLWELTATGRDLVVVAKIPTNWQQRIAQVVGEDATGALRGTIENLVAVGLAASFSSGMELGVVLEAKDEATAANIARQLRTYLDAMTNNMLVSLTPFGPVVRAVRTEQRGTAFLANVSLPRERLEKLIEFATAWQQNRDRQEAADAASGTAAPGSAPGPAQFRIPTPPTPPDAPATP